MLNNILGVAGLIAWGLGLLGVLVVLSGANNWEDEE